MNYSQAIKYLNSFQNLEKEKSYNYNKAHQPERFKKLCDIIGMPQYDFKSILVAGTKGKGSACAILHSILTQAGYKSGLYTSPHIVDLRERIKINNAVITKEEFAKLAGEIKKSIKYAKPDKVALYKNLTFFELLTAISFLYFSKNSIDLAVIETGLGGRLDATNIAYPLVSVITHIGYDHTDLLGKSLDKIAREKAGIIKENSFVVSAPQDKKVINIIRKMSKENASRLFALKKDTDYKCRRVDFKKTVFDYKGIYENYKAIKMPLLGSHQAQNGSVSLAVVEILKRHFYFSIDKQSIYRGFEKVVWPGRFDILSKNPYVIADGAHNIDSAKALKQTICDLFGKRTIDSLILGISVDKDIKGIGSVLCPLAKNVIFTKACSPRAANPDILSKHLSKHCSNSFVAKNPKGAMLLAKRLTPDDGAILVTGSLFLVGDIIKIL